MSAFVVSATHVDVLLSVALHGPSDGEAFWTPLYLYIEQAGARLSLAVCSVLGAGLLAENIASVSHRYPDCPKQELPGPSPMPIAEQYEFTDFGPCMTIAETCAAIDCYAYQSCEHPEGEHGTAHRFCEQLRSRLTTCLPGYKQAPWEWTPETLAAHGLICKLGGALCHSRRRLMAADLTTTPQTSADKRASRRAADRERMKQAIAALQTSDGWQRWLGARRHFHTYSFHNQLLIAHQCPEATHVAGFRAWLKLGYCVRKGEHALRIWAPMPPSKKVLDAWQRAGSNPDDRPRTFFRMVPVFDRSQVDPIPDHPGGPAPLEPPHEPITGAALERCRRPLVALAAALGSEVTFEPIHGAAAGYHEPATGHIVIDNGPDRSPNAEIQTLLHELAHRLVRADRRDDDPRLDYRSEELVAESVAFSVCAGLGLDSSGDSVPYLAGWGGEDAADRIEALARLIDRLAKRIEDAVNAAA